MSMQALSGVDIALWDIAGKVMGQPICKLIGGAHRDSVSVYGYGMMLRPEPVQELAARFVDEAAAIKDMGFAATKMKVGMGPREDIVLAEAVRRGVGADFDFMVDANHAYTTSDAFYVGHGLDELGAYWFEEPIAPEDKDGYRELRAGLKTNIAGGEAEFNRWGWRELLECRGLDIAQPEVCALGGITEYLRVLALLPCASHTSGQPCLGLGHRGGHQPATPCRHATAPWGASSRASHGSNSTPPTTNSVTICWPNRLTYKSKSRRRAVWTSR